jgi:hypothetical protein
MLKVALALSLLTIPALAQAEGIRSFRVKWGSAESLDRIEFQGCNEAMRVEIPGKPKKAFGVELAFDITAGKDSAPCKLIDASYDKANDLSSYTFDVTGQHCMVRVSRHHSTMGGPKGKAEFMFENDCQK